MYLSPKQPLHHSIWILFFLIFNPIVIGMFWWPLSGTILFTSFGATLISLGRLAGLLGAYFVLAQLILIGRVIWVERLFGLDKLSRLHHWNGYLAISLLLIHPVLLTFGYSATTKASLYGQFLDFLYNYQWVFLAFLGLLIFVTTVGLSISIARKHFRYETWYSVHLFNYAAIALVYLHQLQNGTDFANRYFVYYWYALYIFVFGNLIIFRFVRPLYYTWRHQFRVSRIEHETHDTTSLYITGKHLDSFPIRAGQFMILRFLSKKFWWQAHPFSLSVAPNKDCLRVSIKNVGDFTSQVASITPGTRVLIDGPHGIFTQQVIRNNKLLFIAGGVGITPIRSLLEEIAGKKNCVLLYGSKTARDIIFKKELNTLAKSYGIKTYYIMSEDPGWKGEKGRVDRRAIERLVPDYKEREVFLCGPPPMMTSIIALFKEVGFPKNLLHYEKFSLA